MHPSKYGELKVGERVRVVSRCVDAQGNHVGPSGIGVIREVREDALWVVFDARRHQYELVYIGPERTLPLTGTRLRPAKIARVREAHTQTRRRG